MPAVTITELKAHLADYLRRVTEGETFYITRHGVEVAELRPADPVRKVLWEMVEVGELKWSGEPPSLPRGFQPYPNPGRPVSDLVDEDRGAQPQHVEPDAE